MDRAVHAGLLASMRTAISPVERVAMTHKISSLALAATLAALLTACGGGGSDSGATPATTGTAGTSSPTNTTTTGAAPAQTETRAIPDFPLGTQETYIMKVQTDGVGQDDLEGTLVLTPSEDFITLVVISWRDVTEFGTAPQVPFVAGYLQPDGSVVMQDDAGTTKFYGNMESDGGSIRGYWDLGEQRYLWTASCVGGAICQL